MAQSIPQAILLQKSNPAPYAGVLMPTDYARKLEQKSLDAELYKIELQKHEGDVPLYSTPDSGTIIVVGVLCGVLGFFLGGLSH